MTPANAIAGTARTDRQLAAPAATPTRILALCYMLPPALFPQAIQIGRLLAHSRHTIARVSGPLGQPPSTQMPEATGPALTEVGHLNVKEGPPHLVVPDEPPRFPGLHRLGLRALPRYGSVPDEYRDWAKRAVHAVRASADMAAFAPDVIVSFGEPMSDHLLGQALARGFDRPWIAHFSDPWADNPFRRAHKLSRRLNRALETGVVEAADALIFTSEETRQLLARTHGERFLAKSQVLPHSFEPALYPDRTRDGGDRILARYLGNFYGIRSPTPLLRALELIRARDPGLAAKFRFELIGGMPGWMRLHPLVRRADPDSVRFLPSVPYRASLELMVSADLLLVIDAPATESVFLPSKLIDYLGARRPIFGIVPPGTSARVIQGLGGLTADPTEPAAIAQALERLAREMLAARMAGRDATSAAERGPEVAAYEATQVAALFDRIVAETIGNVRGSSRHVTDSARI